MAKTISIIRGSDVNVKVSLKDKNTQEPYDLTGLTGCTGFFPKDDETFLAASGVVASAELGKLTFSLSETDTGSLNVGDGQSVQIDIDKGSERTITQILNSLNVVENLVP